MADAIGLARRVSARGGVLVHLTGRPEIIIARLRAREKTIPAEDRIGAIIDAYHRAFALLRGTAPIVTADTTAAEP
jgi:hypothetical protein